MHFPPNKTLVFSLSHIFSSAKKGRECSEDAFPKCSEASLRKEEEHKCSQRRGLLQPCITKIAHRLQLGDSHFHNNCIQTWEKSSTLQEAERHLTLLWLSWQAGSGCLAPKAGFFFALGLSLYRRFLQIILLLLATLCSLSLSLFSSYRYS